MGPDGSVVALPHRAERSRVGMPIRLLAVHHGGGIGGAPVSLLKLLAAQRPSDFHPRVVFTEAGPILAYARELGVPATLVPTGGAFFHSAHTGLRLRMLGRFVWSFPSALRRAQHALRELQPDLLHLNTSVLLAWAAAARRERVPVVWAVREVLAPTPLVRGWHLRYLQRHARLLVATSGAVAACFPPGAPVRVVHNAVDLDEFRPDLLAQREVVRAELGLARDDSVVMAIGSVQRAKGHWLLLEALETVAAQVPSLRLVLVCGGADAAYASSVRGRLKCALGLPLDNLEALRRDAAARGLARRVQVTGFRRDVARLLVAADVVAFPSLAPEGFGRPIVEAMALARPVVATDVGPSAELLGPDAGLLVPPEAAQLARALVKLLRAPECRERMGRAGRARVEALFSLDRHVAHMSALYREVAGAA